MEGRPLRRRSASTGQLRELARTHTHTHTLGLAPAGGGAAWEEAHTDEGALAAAAAVAAGGGEGRDGVGDAGASMSMSGSCVRASNAGGGDERGRRGSKAGRWFGKQRSLSPSMRRMRLRPGVGAGLLDSDKWGQVCKSSGSWGLPGWGSTARRGRSREGRPTHLDVPHQHADMADEEPSILGVESSPDDSSSRGSRRGGRNSFSSWLASGGKGRGEGGDGMEGREGREGRDTWQFGGSSPWGVRRGEGERKCGARKGGEVDAVGLTAKLTWQERGREEEEEGGEERDEVDERGEDEAVVVCMLEDISARKVMVSAFMYGWAIISPIEMLFHLIPSPLLPFLQERHMSKY